MNSDRIIRPDLEPEGRDVTVANDFSAVNPSRATF
jgi:hypothetical protein